MTNFHLQVIHAAIDNHGFDPAGIYCLITGKSVGLASVDEIEYVIESHKDAEQAADDLAMRALASMRPSMLWNRLREESLDQMRLTRPREVMAYLLNRLMQPLANDKNALNQLSLNKNRIHLFNALQSADCNSERWHLAMMRLLEIESKLSLKPEESPITYAQLLAATDILDVLDRLESWHAKRVEFHAKAEADAKFFAANPGARRAFVTAWFAHKPKSEAVVKKESKQQEQNLMSAILQELMQPGIHSEKPMTQRPVMPTVKPAAPRPSTKMPARFGAKKAGV